MRKFSSLLLAVTVLAAFSAQSAHADGWHHGHDIHSFHDHDFDYWRGGRWFNGFHEGRTGWWWIVNGGWYFYPEPVYPYPDPYTPPTVIVEPSAPAVVTTAPVYYYCRNPAGYYPYVSECLVHWRKVVSTGAPSTVVVTQPAQPAPSAGPAPIAPTTMHTETSREREADERQLQLFSEEDSNIDLTGQQAMPRLESLKKKVASFHKSLYERQYNAMSLSSNVETLQRHIDEQMGALKKGSLVPPPTE